PVLLELRDDARRAEPAWPPAAAWPALALAAAVLVLPGRVGWVDHPIPHWPGGVGFAALGAAIALLPRGRSRSPVKGPKATPAVERQPEAATGEAGAGR
ncbi:MAG: hypothetical protein WKF86_09000, partial [Acidimicrobiales bacterium]